MQELLDNEVTSYLNLTQHPEVVELYDEARTLLVTVGYTYLEANLFKALPNYTTNGSFEAKLLIAQAIKDSLKEVINSYGVKIELDAKVSTLTEILSLLRLAETTSQHDEVCQFIDDDELSLGETLEGILGLVSIDELSDELVMCLGDCYNSNFLERMKMVHLTELINSTGEASDERLNKEYLDSIRKFLANYPNSLVAELYRGKNILFGEDLNHYVNENREALEALCPSDPGGAAIALVGMAVYGGVALTGIHAACRTASTNFYTDLSFKMAVVQNLNNLIAEMSSEQYNKASVV